MAVDTSDNPPTEEEDTPVAELVFSCCICQATITDVYATVESNQGFHSGSSGEDGIVTKMYIGNCSHVICAKHLENGTIPFHPEDQHPQVACPRCKIERDDNSPKDMFAIQGLNPGQYDPTIPEIWTHCPPIKLDDSITGMDAMRFQYMALCHYGREIRKRWKAALHNLSTSEAAVSKERKIRKRLQLEQAKQQKKIESMQKAEAHLKKWEDRKPVINHYMNAFSEMTKDNERMRGQLIELGFDVPVRRYLFNSGEDTQSSQKHSDAIPTEPRVASSTTIDPDNQQVSHNDSSSSARKRKHDENFTNPVARNDRQPSRELMPPPLPRPSQRSVPRESPSRQPAISRSHVLQQPKAFDNGLHLAQNRPGSRSGPHLDPGLAFGHASSQSKQLVSQASPFGSQHVQAAACQRSVPQSGTLPFGYAPESRRINHHSISLAQLSLQSAGLEEQQMNYAAQNQQVFEYDYDTGPSTEAFYPQSQSQESVAPQYDYNNHDPLPVRPSYSSYQSPHTMVSLQRQDDPATRTPHGQIQNHSRYGNSPFFDHRGSAAQPHNMERPPARGNQTQQQFRNFVDNYRIPTATTIGPQSFDEDPTSRRGYSSRTYQPQYQSPQQYHRPATNRQQHITIPQTPRNSQGLFRRPDRLPPPPVFRSPSKPEARHRSGRLTLPPSSTGHIPFSMDQDSAISQIRGVRGMSSYRSAPAYRSSAPTYANDRPLFSAAGRQSIRR